MKLVYKIHKPISLIIDYLTDMQKFVSVHPVIYKIDKLDKNKYLVYETLKLGFIPVSFTYPAIIESNFIDTVTIRATVMKLSKIEMVFTLKVKDNFTLVEENIRFNSPLPIKSIMESIFRKQHSLLFKNIELTN